MLSEDLKKAVISAINEFGTYENIKESNLIDLVVLAKSMDSADLHSLRISATPILAPIESPDMEVSKTILWVYGFAGTNEAFSELAEFSERFGYSKVEQYSFYKLSKWPATLLKDIFTELDAGQIDEGKKLEKNIKKTCGGVRRKANAALKKIDK